MQQQTDTPSERPARYDYDALLRCARGELFGPGNAQLPAPPMLMFDRIVSISGLDALWQLTGFFLGWLGMPGRGRALGVGEVKFSGQVTPASSLVRYTVNLKRIIDRKLKMGIADGILELDGEVIYTIKDMRVGLFTDDQAAA